jgi:hypothetical protein
MCAIGVMFHWNTGALESQKLIMHGLRICQMYIISDYHYEEKIYKTAEIVNIFQSQLQCICDV